MRACEAAWNAHDFDAIVAFNTPDGLYRLRVARSPCSRAAPCCRERSAPALEKCRERFFHLERIHSGDGFYVWESMIRDARE